MNTLTKEILISELANFMGTEQWYRHPLAKSMLYTDGVKHFADRTQSYWLLDVIATEYYPMLIDDEPFLFITVESNNNAASIIVTDGNENQLNSKQIPYTDLLEGKWSFYLTDDVLLLPSEY